MKGVKRALSVKALKLSRDLGSGTGVPDVLARVNATSP